MAIRLATREPGFPEAFTAFVDARRGVEERVEEEVAAILAEVRARGDDALLEYTERFDGVRLTPDRLRVDPGETERAYETCPRPAREALDLAADRIRSFHRRQFPVDLDYRDELGVRLGARWRPIPSVGVYVPGGTASYPSTALMNVIPARIAGVTRIAMAVPASGGTVNPLVLAAAHVAGATEIYRVGGAQAIAALAFGTKTIAAVDKVVGPGNAYVAVAKRLVFGTVGIDLVAGPSEILVVADRDNDPMWIAADLLSQAEHGTESQAVLIVDDEKFADAVECSMNEALKTLPRAEIARGSWEAHGAIIRVAGFEEAVPIINRLAPEHVELAVADAEELAARIENAGAIFLGRFTPEAVGDYVAGPNHVLPTARSARFSSGLGVVDFMKRTTLVACDKRSLATIGPAAVTLAEAEELDAHALSVNLRLNRSSGGWDGAA